MENAPKSLARARSTIDRCRVNRSFGWGQRILGARMLYLSTALTILAGWAHAPWWAAVASSCVIALLLFREDTRDFAPPGEEASWELAESLTNILIGGVSGPLAFALGRGLSLLV